MRKLPIMGMALVDTVLDYRLRKRYHLKAGYNLSADVKGNMHYSAEMNYMHA